MRVISNDARTMVRNDVVSHGTTTLQYKQEPLTLNVGPDGEGGVTGVGGLGEGIGLGVGRLVIGLG